jgi:hypothetical protein
LAEVVYMALEYIPLLEKQRELYTIPRGMERFKEYLKTVVGSATGHDLELPPLVAMNPMAKEHALEHVEALLALGVDEVARQAVQEAEERLEIKARLKVSTVLLDDLKGGWTNRYLNEARDYFQPADGVKKFSWIIVPCWTVDKPSRHSLRQTALAYVYRAMYALEHGNPRTLRDVLKQEGLVMRFAGIEQWLELDDLAYSLEVITPHLDSTHYPTQFACLFGDRAAKTVGYPPFGLSERAGFAVALEPPILDL